MNADPSGPRALRALVTGASSGIGEALSLRLARRGYEVWLAARRVPELERVRDAIAAAGGRAHVFALDVAQGDATAAAVAALDQQVGGFDLVVANAGVGAPQAAATFEWSSLRDTVTTNALGAMATLAAVVPAMMARHRGHVVAVSSLSADVAGPGSPAYAASKAFLTHFTSSLRAELTLAGVDCTVIHPGFIRTAMTAGNSFTMPFLMEVDEAAKRIDDAIDRRVAIYRFPRRMWWLIRLFNLIPRPVREALMRTALRRRAG